MRRGARPRGMEIFIIIYAQFQHRGYTDFLLPLRKELQKH